MDAETSFPDDLVGFSRLFNIGWPKLGAAVLVLLRPKLLWLMVPRPELALFLSCFRLLSLAAFSISKKALSNPESWKSIDAIDALLSSFDSFYSFNYSLAIFWSEPIFSSLSTCLDLARVGNDSGRRMRPTFLGYACGGAVYTSGCCFNLARKFVLL